MYKLLLTWKYLRRKLAPLFAAVAVTLCTAMTVIVISVMGGFLDTLKDTARGTSGDIIVAGGLSGFEDYEGLVDIIRGIEGVAVAEPVLETLGIVKGPRGNLAVQLQGVDFAGLDGITGFGDLLVWDDATRAERISGMADLAAQVHAAGGDTAERVPRPEVFTGLLRPLEQLGSAGSAAERQVAIPGIETLGTHARQDDGGYDFGYSMVAESIEITVVPISAAGAIQNLEAATRRFTIANEFKSDFYQVDSGTVVVPFGVLQAMLDMAPTTVTVGADAFGEGGRTESRPGSTHQILVKAADPAADLDPLESRVRNAVRAYYDGTTHSTPYTPRVYTWREKHGMIIGAVEKEKGLVTFLFGIISIVAVVMVATTFYMIVLEKTRDIGVLRAIGAARAGIASLFLAYGLAIGLLGAAAGLALAAAIVLNLNWIQDQLAAWFGWRMWDPQTYFFTEIPARIDPTEALWIGCGAVVASVLGAVIPALLAARLDPVKALRYE